MTEQRPGTGDEPKPDTHQQPPYGQQQGSDIPAPPLYNPPLYSPPGQQFGGQHADAGTGGAYGQPVSPYGQHYGQQYGQQYNQQYSSPYGQPSYYGAAPQPKGLSIASLCCGIAVYLGFGVFILPQLAAVILGHMALRREPSGRGFAIAGLVMGYLGLVLTVLAIVGLAILASVASTSSTI
ncbi:DUF4190 domain-containing protein [Arthrobacter sp. IA7]|uniref:DUF4190 domain-containing protein n=1 Tax=Arthrobacter ipis TaxID=2716202 RepID=UPI001689E36C|nr:DUF4190 domain-containing protein [Arthrobacter ipis]MBD1542877.1 DUF4190 domain-containing protein [Arthrobacter ipis]